MHSVTPVPVSPGAHPPFAAEPRAEEALGLLFGGPQASLTPCHGNPASTWEAGRWISLLSCPATISQLSFRTQEGGRLGRCFDVVVSQSEQDPGTASDSGGCGRRAAAQGTLVSGGFGHLSGNYSQLNGKPSLFSL